MANLSDLLKGQRINKLQTGAIAAHVNQLIKTDDQFKMKFQTDPVGMLINFGLTRRVATGLIAETINNQQSTVMAGITDCCCTASVTFSCGGAFYKDLPAINDLKAWTKLAGIN